MALIMSPHESFVFLVEKIPDWQREINTLSYRAHVKNTEFVAEYARLVSNIRPRRKKSPSINSLHTTENQPPPSRSSIPEPEISADNPPSPLDRVEIDPFEAGNKYLYAQARRKRKPGTSIRSGASGPQKFRNKNQVVVYYDGFLQEHLDALLRLVGSGRNNLRRGKNSLVALRGFQLPRLSKPMVRSSVDPFKSRSVSMPLGKKLTNMEPTDPTDFETVFLQVDKELESIQSLCETAAHQFLRDGDCQTEMDTIKEKLKALHQRAKATAELLKTFEAERSKNDDTLDCGASDNTLSSGSDSTLSTKRSMDFLCTPKLTAGLTGFSHGLGGMKDRPTLFSAPGLNYGQEPPSLVADSIEVDDESDQEDFVVDINAYRVAHARRARV